MADIQGKDAKLYYGAAVVGAGADPSATSWTELTKARDVSLGIDVGESDASTRASSWKYSRPNLKAGGLEIELLWDNTNAGQTALRDACLNGTPISMACMDGSIAVTGSQGFVSNMNVYGFNRPEPLTDGVMLTITVKPHSEAQWYTVA